MMLAQYACAMWGLARGRMAPKPSAWIWAWSWGSFEVYTAPCAAPTLRRPANHLAGLDPEVILTRSKSSPKEGLSIKVGGYKFV